MCVYVCDSVEWIQAAKDSMAGLCECRIEHRNFTILCYVLTKMASSASDIFQSDTTRNLCSFIIILTSDSQNSSVCIVTRLRGGGSTARDTSLVQIFQTGPGIQSPIQSVPRFFPLGKTVGA